MRRWQAGSVLSLTRQTAFPFQVFCLPERALSSEPNLPPTAHQHMNRTHSDLGWGGHFSSRAAMER